MLYVADVFGSIVNVNTSVSVRDNARVEPSTGVARTRGLTVESLHAAARAPSATMPDIGTSL
jgi:hypothetical protein